MRLLGVEVTRLLARRLFRLAVLLIFAGLVIALAITAYQSRPPTQAERNAAQAQAERDRRQAPPIEERIADCERAKQSGQGPPANFDCRSAVRDPRAEDYLQDKIFHFRAAIRDRITAFAVGLALVGFVVGASFVGAEWATGTLAALLTWEPRRLRVLAAKALGLALGLAAVAAAALALVIGGHAGVAVWRGDPAGTTGGLLVSTALTGLRGLVLAVVAGLAGFSIAAAVRNTAAALGAGFAYFLGVELLLRNIWKGSSPWLLTSNVEAWLMNGTRVPIPLDCPPAVECRIRFVFVSLGDSAVYFAVVVAVLALSAVTLSRRDVT